MMTVERARQVLLEVLDLRKRWGRKVSNQDFNKDDLLDALVVLQEHNEETVHAQVVKLHRQIGASKAREAKLKKDKTALERQLIGMQQKCAAAQRVVESQAVELGVLRDKLTISSKT